MTTQPPVLRGSEEDGGMTEEDGFRIVDGVAWIGARPFPWASKVRAEDIEGEGYKHSTRGFYLTFENGYTLSVQWGMGTYCVNHDSFGFHENDPPFRPVSPTAEIALWNKDGDWFNWGSDTVRGWNTTDDVLKVIEAVATWPTSEFGPNPLEGGDDE